MPNCWEEDFLAYSNLMQIASEGISATIVGGNSFLIDLMMIHFDFLNLLVIEDYWVTVAILIARTCLDISQPNLLGAYQLNDLKWQVQQEEHQLNPMSFACFNFKVDYFNLSDNYAFKGDSVRVVELVAMNQNCEDPYLLDMVRYLDIPS